MKVYLGLEFQRYPSWQGIGRAASIVSDGRNRELRYHTFNLKCEAGRSNSKYMEATYFQSPLAMTYYL